MRMSRKPKGPHVLGPYRNQRRHGVEWRVVPVKADGSRGRGRTFDSERDALEYKEFLEQQLIAREFTTEMAIAAYKTFLTETKSWT